MSSLVLLVATTLVVSICTDCTRSVRRTINVGDTVNSSLTAVECGGGGGEGEGGRLVTCDVLLSKYGNVRIFLKLPYPTKRACAVIHIRPKVSPTKNQSASK